MAKNEMPLNVKGNGVEMQVQITQREVIELFVYEKEQELEKEFNAQDAIVNEISIKVINLNKKARAEALTYLKKKLNPLIEGVKTSLKKLMVLDKRNITSIKQAEQFGQWHGFEREIAFYAHLFPGRDNNQTIWIKDINAIDNIKTKVLVEVRMIGLGEYQIEVPIKFIPSWKLRADITKSWKKERAILAEISARQAKIHEDTKAFKANLTKQLLGVDNASEVFNRLKESISVNLVKKLKE